MQIISSFCMTVTVVICNMPTSCQNFHPCTEVHFRWSYLINPPMIPLLALSLIEEISRLSSEGCLSLATFLMSLSWSWQIPALMKPKRHRIRSFTSLWQSCGPLHFWWFLLCFPIWQSGQSGPSIGRRPVSYVLLALLLTASDSLSLLSLCEWSMYYRCSA